MGIPWIDAHTPLPDPSRAQTNGLVAAGEDLSPMRLDEAYRKGLFPWYNPGEPVLWWSPDPRMVLDCDALHVGHSLAKRVRQFDHPVAQAPLRVTVDLAFDAVMAHCARRPSTRLALGAARTEAWPAPAHPEHGGTWIGPDVMAAYGAWHVRGAVHSVETWIDGQLAGGLYGVSLGACFFGESMFSLVSDASKVALVYLVRFLQRAQVPWVDCQQETRHLARLGARPIARGAFMARLATGLAQPAPAWRPGRLRADGRLIPISA